MNGAEGKKRQSIREINNTKEMVALLLHLLAK